MLVFFGCHHLIFKLKYRINRLQWVEKTHMKNYMVVHKYLVLPAFEMHIRLQTVKIREVKEMRNDDNIYNHHISLIHIYSYLPDKIFKKFFGR